MSGMIPAAAPFALTCERCDAGGEIETYDEALNFGWSEIRDEPDRRPASFIGLCPDCRLREEA